MARETYTIRNVNQNCVVATDVMLAGCSHDRRKGLTGRKRLEEGEGLWIAPCEAIHTFGMKMPIDVIFLDRSLKVRHIRRQLRPLRISVCLRAHSVLELASGAASRSGTNCGDQMEIHRNIGMDAGV